MSTKRCTEAVVFNFDTATLEFIDGGKVRIRVWDPEMDTVATYNLVLTKSKQWAMTAETAVLLLNTDQSLTH